MISICIVEARQSGFIASWLTPPRPEYGYLFSRLQFSKLANPKTMYPRLLIKTIAWEDGSWRSQTWPGIRRLRGLPLDISFVKAQVWPTQPTVLPGLRQIWQQAFV